MQPWLEDIWKTHIFLYSVGQWTEDSEGQQQEALIYIFKLLFKNI